MQRWICFTRLNMHPMVLLTFSILSLAENCLTEIYAAMGSGLGLLVLFCVCVVCCKKKKIENQEEPQEIIKYPYVEPTTCYKINPCRLAIPFVRQASYSLIFFLSNCQLRYLFAIKFQCIRTQQFLYYSSKIFSLYFWSKRLVFQCISCKMTKFSGFASLKKRRLFHKGKESWLH